MSPFAGGLAGGADHLILNTGPFCLISWPGLLYPGDNGLSSIVLTLQHGMWPFRSFRASLVAQMVKNSPATWKTWVNPWAGKTLEEGMATHSSILAWRIPMDRGTWRAAVHGVTKSQTWLSNEVQHSNWFISWPGLFYQDDNGQSITVLTL